ncbi:MAG TPA: hypothetical protein PK022_08585 [Syntrophales bacterium]|nr:hypothetical protein [Syntrophales bacterium]
MNILGRAQVASEKIKELDPDVGKNRLFLVRRTGAGGESASMEIAKSMEQIIANNIYEEIVSIEKLPKQAVFYHKGEYRYEIAPSAL